VAEEDPKERSHLKRDRGGAWEREEKASEAPTAQSKEISLACGPGLNAGCLSRSCESLDLCRPCSSCVSFEEKGGGERMATDSSG
jgi:hypothetical protein